MARPVIQEHPNRPFRLAPEQQNEEQRALVESILSGPRKDLPINMEIWLNNPKFAVVANSFAEYVGHTAPMTRRIKEIVILVVAAYLRSEFEWFWHERLAKQLEIAEDQIAAIKENKDAYFADEVEQVSHDLTVAFLRTREVSDELHERAMRLLGHQGVADITGLIGLYQMVAFALDFYKVPLPKI